MQEHRIQCEGGELLTVSASFGVSCSDPARHQTFDTILKAADEALYRAKAQGRNRVYSSHQITHANHCHFQGMAIDD